MNIIKNEDGMVHSLEAILGIFLIIGTMTFVSGMIPLTNQKTEEHSKVQLVNVGRDVLDLIEQAPIRDIFDNYSKSQGVNRTYTLIPDKIYVAPGSPINFSIYYLDTTNLVTDPLTMQCTFLGTKTSCNNFPKSITNPYAVNFSSVGEYSIIVHSTINPSMYSNFSNIIVGNYFLISDIYGIFTTGNVNGYVFFPNWANATNLTLQILDNNYNVIVNNMAMTNETGYFTFTWPDKDDGGHNINTGTYYIRAIDSNGISSNIHEIIYSDKNNGGLLCCGTTIYETDSVTLTVTNYTFNNLNNLAINGITYNKWTDITKIFVSSWDGTTVTLTAYSAGDYIIQVMDNNGADLKTNAVEIIVLPLINTCKFGSCGFDCGSSYISSSNIKSYLTNIFVPSYINYNLYLIDIDGDICKECKNFPPIINGNPTGGAATVSKLIFVKTSTGNHLKELRIILWYK